MTYCVQPRKGLVEQFIKSVSVKALYAIFLNEKKKKNINHVYRKVKNKFSTTALHQKSL